MTIDYTTEIKDTYILIHPAGTTDSPDELLKYIDSFIADCKEHDKKNVLLDHRTIIFSRKHAGFLELAAKCIDKMAAARPLRVAMTVRPERMEFVKAYESIGFNHGVEIKTFDNMKMARVWLNL